MMRALALLLFVVMTAPVLAQDKGPTVRPEVGKPLQAAVELLKQRRAREALARAREAQAVPDKTAYESYMVTRVIGQSAAVAGDAATAAPALESAAASSAAPEADKRQLLAMAAGQYYALKEYGKASSAATRYFQYGGSDKSIRTIYINSLYLGGNYGAASREANTAPGRIRQRLFHGDFVQYIVDWPAGQLTVRRPPTEMFEEGAAVAVSFAAEHCVLLET